MAMQGNRSVFVFRGEPVLGMTSAEIGETTYKLPLEAHAFFRDLARADESVFQGDSGTNIVQLLNNIAFDYQGLDTFYQYGGLVRLMRAGFTDAVHNRFRALANAASQSYNENYLKTPEELKKARDLFVVALTAKGTMRAAVEAGIEESIIGALGRLAAASSEYFDSVMGRLLQDPHDFPEFAKTAKVSSRDRSHKIRATARLLELVEKIEEPVKFIQEMADRGTPLASVFVHDEETAGYFLSWIERLYESGRKDMVAAALCNAETAYLLRQNGQKPGRSDHDGRGVSRLTEFFGRLDTKKEDDANILIAAFKNDFFIVEENADLSLADRAIYVRDFSPDGPKAAVMRAAVESEAVVLGFLEHRKSAGFLFAFDPQDGVNNATIRKGFTPAVLGRLLERRESKRDLMDYLVRFDLAEEVKRNDSIIKNILMIAGHRDSSAVMRTNIWHSFCCSFARMMQDVGKGREAGAFLRRLKIAKENGNLTPEFWGYNLQDSDLVAAIRICSGEEKELVSAGVGAGKRRSKEELKPGCKLQPAHPAPRIKPGQSIDERIKRRNAREQEGEKTTLSPAEIDKLSGGGNPGHSGGKAG